jgi:hypothetical protein
MLGYSEFVDLGDLTQEKLKTAAGNLPEGPKSRITGEEYLDTLIDPSI